MAMQRDGWWWGAPGITDKAIRRVLAELAEREAEQELERKQREERRRHEEDRAADRAEFRRAFA